MAIVRYSDGILVEVDDEVATSHTHGMSVVSPTQLMASFEDVARDVKAKVDTLGGQLLTAATGPKDVTIEFGIDIEGTAGLAVLARGSAACHLRVTAHWVRA